MRKLSAYKKENMMTSEYISKRCGSVTIQLTNSMSPQTPLFSPITREVTGYRQSKSNNSRPLMYPEEILQMDNRECLVLIRGHKPLKGLKIIPDEFSAYRQLTYARVADYIPHWRAAEEDTKEKRDAGTKASTEAIPTSQKVVDDTQMKSAQAAKSEGTAIPRIAANETIFMPEDVKEADSVFAETSVDDILND